MAVLEQDKVDVWRPMKLPEVAPELIPFLKEYMKQNESTSASDLGCVYREALDRMCPDGPETSKQQATAALIIWSARRPRIAGETWDCHVIWGGRYPSMDYAAQELAIGGHHFLRVDMGYDVPLGTKMRTALGEPDKLERNHCVFAHLALGMEWVDQGRPRRIPNKSRVMSLASLIRSAELQQAQMFMKVREKPETKDGSKLFPIAHDVMSSHRGRNFQDVNLALSNTEISVDNRDVRILDLESRHNKTMIKVYQFGDMVQQTGLGMSINLLVWRGHMRFLLPPTDTRIANWMDLDAHVGRSHRTTGRPGKPLCTTT